VTAANPRPLTPRALAQLVADRTVALQSGHPVRLAIDGPPWSGLDLARLVSDAIRSWSRPCLVVRVADYLRPASLRLERGRDDPDAFYDDWVDVAGLRREVLDPCGPGGSRRVLPTLWDATRDRASRADYLLLAREAVIVVDGWFLLRDDLPFDLTVHVALSPAARARRVPDADMERELPAYDRYDQQARPVDRSDVVVRADDPRHPAVIDRIGVDRLT
jgi:hypothetical protein